MNFIYNYILSFQLTKCVAVIFIIMETIRLFWKIVSLQNCGIFERILLIILPNQHFYWTLLQHKNYKQWLKTQCVYWSFSFYLVLCGRTLPMNTCNNDTLRVVHVAPGANISLTCRSIQVEAIPSSGQSPQSTHGLFGKGFHHCSFNWNI